MKSIFYAAALVGLVGCVSPGPSVQLPAFPVAEYEALPKEGTGTVTGQVFLKTVGGDVKYGAGSQVLLTPVTSYSEFAAAHDDSRLPPPDPRMASFSKVTQADGMGNFRFENVPPGDYYLVSNLTWDVIIPNGFFPIHEPQGGWLRKSVKVENGKETRQMLTRD